MRRAAAVGLAAIALTDHDSLDGLPQATQAARAAGVHVVAGCEFSVKASWGEMHLLGYFLPHAEAELERFLSVQRSRRATRMAEIVRRLNGTGVTVTLEEVGKLARGGAMGRPHAARALVRRGMVRDVGEAFDRYLGWKRPAFVPKDLPAAADVIALIRQCGGVSSAAHLKDRAVRANLEQLRDIGLDAVEVRHPSHDEPTSARIARLAEEFDLLPSGGSDWHGDAGAEEPHRALLGSVEVPIDWLERIERLHAERRPAEVS